VTIFRGLAAVAEATRPAPTPPGVTGVRRILNNAAHRALATRHAEAWSCLIAHGTERQGTWAPGIAPTIWSDLGPA